MFGCWSNGFWALAEEDRSVVGRVVRRFLNRIDLLTIVLIKTL